jgi:hypothetical protein
MFSTSPPGFLGGLINFFSGGTDSDTGPAPMLSSEIQKCL